MVLKHTKIASTNRFLKNKWSFLLSILTIGVVSIAAFNYISAQNGGPDVFGDVTETQVSRVITPGTAPITALDYKVTNDQLTAGEFNRLVRDVAQNSGSATYAGLTAASNGAVGGYQAASDLCNAAFAGSHVCSSEELISAAADGQDLGSFDQAWVNNGPPGYLAVSTNDCKGWNNGTTGYNGSVYHRGRNEFLLLSCNLSIPFTCCQ